MKTLKERLEEKIKNDAIENHYRTGEYCTPNSCAASLVPLVLELAEGLKRVKPSLNIAFEDTNDLYYKNVEADLDEALQSIEKFLEGKK